jgi:hypothetical protein
VLALGLSAVVFFHSSVDTQIASHDAVIRPDLSGEVVVRTGPVLPDVRIDSGSRIGAAVTLGKTDVSSTDQLVERYALIASSPEGPENRVRSDLQDLLRESALRGGALAVVPLLLWGAVGSQRRWALLRGARSWRGVAVLATGALVVVGIAQPWDADQESVEDQQTWQTISQFLGSEVPVPTELDGVQVRGDVTTNQTRRLVESAVSTYETSKTFYADLAESAESLELRQPEEGETVVLLVSDRHDNIGMDQVARAVGDAGGATAVYDAGDDTSTGSSWEGFSLDSLDATLSKKKYGDDRWAITGNHDNGTFVGEYLADHGWTLLSGEAVDGPDDSRLLGVGDPRSSGLGNWRDESGLSFSDVGSRLADAACEAQDDGERIGTILIHDANMGAEALSRGCVDLVLGGHVHTRSGPTRVDGENGAVGYTYTTGTTGGAAYAIAVGSKLRRPADIGLITYRDGRPVGIQGVLVQTTGEFDVAPWTELTPAGPPSDSESDSESDSPSPTDGESDSSSPSSPTTSTPATGSPAPQ